MERIDRRILNPAPLVAIGTAATPFVRSEWALIAVLGIVSAFGAGAGSLSILIGSVMQRLPSERPLVRGGDHQCRRVARAICLCADRAGGDPRFRLGGGDARRRRRDLADPAARLRDAAAQGVGGG
jgi:hypothetical protein